MFWDQIAVLFVCRGVIILQYKALPNEWMCSQEQNSFCHVAYEKVYLLRGEAGYSFVIQRIVPDINISLYAAQPHTFLNSALIFCCCCWCMSWLTYCHSWLWWLKSPFFRNIILLRPRTLSILSSEALRVAFWKSVTYQRAEEIVR